MTAAQAAAERLMVVRGYVVMGFSGDGAWPVSDQAFQHWAGLDLSRGYTLRVASRTTRKDYEEQCAILFGDKRAAYRFCAKERSQRFYRAILEVSGTVNSTSPDPTKEGKRGE